MKRKRKVFECLVDVLLRETDVGHVTFWHAFEASEETVRRAIQEALSDLPIEIRMPDVDLKCKLVYEGSALDHFKRRLRAKIVLEYRRQKAIDFLKRKKF